MTESDANFWNVFHDGYLIDITGEFPGKISLKIEIEYIRKKFKPEGKSFIVTLHGFKHLYFLKDGKTIKNPKEILYLEPIISRATILKDGQLSIKCVSGSLYLDYENLDIQLENGKVITTREIEFACYEYWKDLKGFNPLSCLFVGILAILIFFTIIIFLGEFIK
ncbi:MAG: hypothetical protein P8012_09050 [Desulfobacterales bacterium]